MVCQATWPALCIEPQVVKMDCSGVLSFVSCFVLAFGVFTFASYFVPAFGVLAFYQLLCASLRGTEFYRMLPCVKKSPCASKGLPVSLAHPPDGCRCPCVYGEVAVKQGGGSRIFKDCPFLPLGVAFFIGNAPYGI